MNLTEQHKHVYRCVIAAVSAGDNAALDDFLAADMVDHNPVPNQAAGIAGFKQWMLTARTSFPDLLGTVETVLAEDSLLAARVIWRGTHRGSFVGIAPTGKPVVLPAFHMVRFSAGRIVEWWGMADLLGALQQLGAQVTVPQE